MASPSCSLVKHSKLKTRCRAIPRHSTRWLPHYWLRLVTLSIANEGKLLAIVAPEKVDAALAAMRNHPLGHETRVIGTVQAEPAGMVFLRTDIGGIRVLDMLVGDPLPRIC